MNDLRVWTHSREERAQVERDLRDLLGTRLISMEYIYPQHYIDEIVEVREGFDIVTASLALSLENGSFVRVAGAIEGTLEGLSIHIAAPASPIRPKGTERSLAPSAMLLRQVHLPQAVTEVGASWHSPDDSSVQALWSIRLALLNGTGLTIALGELGPTGSLEYIPDTLVAIYDESIARSYQIPASSDAAWGTTITSEAAAPD